MTILSNIFTESVYRNSEYIGFIGLYAVLAHYEIIFFSYDLIPIEKQETSEYSVALHKFTIMKNKLQRNNLNITFRTEE